MVDMLSTNSKRSRAVGKEILRTVLVLTAVALSGCSAGQTAPTPQQPQKTATATDYAPLMPYAGLTCTGKIGPGTNADTYSADGGMMRVDHAYSLKTGMLQTGGMYHAHDLAITATGDAAWPFQFTSPVSGSVQMLKPVAGARTLEMRVSAGGTWYTATYTCK
jgi:hypothetical protein